MSEIVCSGAVIRCDQGAAPSSLTVLPVHQTSGVSLSVATVMDHAPTVNIAPFGMCRSPSNPQVAAATSAAGGTLTPQPCIPVTTSPWSSEVPSVTVRNLAVLDKRATCRCAWGGTISIENPGASGITSG